MGKDIVRRKTENEYVRRTIEGVYSIYEDPEIDMVVRAQGDRSGWDCEECVKLGIQEGYDEVGGPLSRRF